MKLGDAITAGLRDKNFHFTEDTSYSESHGKVDGGLCAAALVGAKASGETINLSAEPSSEELQENLVKVWPWIKNHTWSTCPVCDCAFKNFGPDSDVVLMFLHLDSHYSDTRASRNDIVNYLLRIEARYSVVRK